MSGVTSLSTTSPASVSVASPPASPVKSRPSSHNAQLLTKSKQCSVMSPASVKTREVSIIMSSPEHGLEGEPVMENLVFISQRAPTDFVVAFDRQREVSSSFAQDADKIQQGNISNTRQVELYMGRAAAAATQVYSQLRKEAVVSQIVISFICIYCGPLTQWERHTLNSLAFRGAMEKEVRKVNPDANFVINTMAHTYLDFCKKLDAQGALGMTWPWLEHLRKYKLAAVFDEVLKLPVNLQTFGKLKMKAIDEGRGLDAKYYDQKEQQVHDYLEALTESYDLKVLLKGNKLGRNGEFLETFIKFEESNIKVILAAEICFAPCLKRDDGQKEAERCLELATKENVTGENKSVAEAIEEGKRKLLAECKRLEEKLLGDLKKNEEKQNESKLNLERLDQQIKALKSGVRLCACRH
eukprot:TRINITY_DN14513_c0_g2_i1.p1 TRINITY_DN14513_c0_g2~~TRINITY_DN14513_c0_g2_i1.p1  ORF type:complete len:412 (+),score=56.68 TRINITY_DN14513_c0_g2_i1:234-1469(+)